MVADGVAEQRNIAALGGIDAATVNDATLALAAEGLGIAVQAGVIHVQGGSHQPADIDLGTRAEQDAVGVDQVHLPVGIEVTEDLGAAGVKDAVDRDGGSRGLNEIDSLLRPNVEAFPID